MALPKKVAKTVIEKSEPETKLPEKVKLLSLFGFYDDEGQLHMWNEGLVVEDPVQIEMIVSNGARWE